jgi:broad specificity phosphatase PhoE
MRLTLLCHAATTVVREGGFPAVADPVDEREHRRIVALSRLDAAVQVTSPDAAAVTTASLLGLVAQPNVALRGADYGSWAGRRFDELATAEPDAFVGWLGSPWTATPGGEPFADVVARVGGWLDALDADAPLLAIAGPSVIRAVLCHALAMPPPVAMRIDIAPLERAILSRNSVWRLQTLSA